MALGNSVLAFPPVTKYLIWLTRRGKKFIDNHSSNGNYSNYQESYQLRLSKVVPKFQPKSLISSFCYTAFKHFVLIINVCFCVAINAN